MEEEKKEEKKGNAFSNFFKKTKEKISDSMLESNLDSEFTKKNNNFQLYKKEGFSKKLHGFTDGNAIIVYGEIEVPEYSVIIDENDKAFYTGAVEKASVFVDYEGQSYERPGTKITLDENVEEVNVIGAGNRYFIYKGEKK